MNRQRYIKVSGVVFAIICILHICRAVFSWDAVIGGWAAPMWISWIAMVITACLSYFAFKLLKE